MIRYISLIGFVTLVLGGGLLIGALNTPGVWHEELVKPGFNPPNWVFGPVWTILYIMIGFAGWRIWLQQPKSTDMIIWWVQLGLNFLWSPVFFTAHRIDLALTIIVLLLLCIVLLFARSLNTDRWVALLLLPYVAWVSFAAALNGAIFMLN